MKVGSFKLVVAEDADSVKEVLVKKSADYAGRPPFHSFVISTLGMSCELLIILLSLKKIEKISTRVLKANIQILTFALHQCFASSEQSSQDSLQTSLFLLQSCR